MKMKAQIVKHASHGKPQEMVDIEGDEIRISLDHERVFSIRRDLVKGGDGIHVDVWSEREGRTEGVRIVVRPVSFRALNLTVETQKP